jgi:hypothetical protein
MHEQDSMICNSFSTVRSFILSSPFSLYNFHISYYLFLFSLSFLFFFIFFSFNFISLVYFFTNFSVD